MFSVVYRQSSAEDVSVNRQSSIAVALASLTQRLFQSIQSNIAVVFNQCDRGCFSQSNPTQRLPSADLTQSMFQSGQFNSIQQSGCLQPVQRSRCLRSNQSNAADVLGSSQPNASDVLGRLKPNAAVPAVFNVSVAANPKQWVPNKDKLHKSVSSHQAR